MKKCLILVYLFLFFSFSALAKDLNHALDLLPDNVKQFLKYEQQYMSLSVDPTRLNMGVGNTQEKFFAPESGNVFELESFWMNVEDHHVFKSPGLDQEIEAVMYREKDGVKQVRFFVHPESKEFYKDVLVGLEKADSFFATATSSSRSLLVWQEDVAPFFAKVSLNKEVSAVVRTIPKSEISRSIGTNNTLIKSKETLPKAFKWMQETIGVLPQGMDRGGMLIRQFPKGIFEDGKSLIPLFALYGGNSAQGPPVLVNMINKSNMPASEFINQKIIEPFAKMWLGTTIDVGFSMEAHAQNSLIELDKHGLPTGNYVFRDLGGFDVDFSYRKSLGYKEAELPFVTNFAKEYHQEELTNALRKSLYNHYEGGFLYNLNKDIPKWMNEGLIAREELAGQHFSRQLNAAFGKYYLERTGIRLPKEFQMHEMADHVKTARTSILGNVSEQKYPKSLTARAVSFLYNLFPWACDANYTRDY